jgi:hypothetical protein
VPLVAALVMVVAVAALGIVAVGSAELRRARVDAVADVTALAAVHDRSTGAAAVAAGNGAALLRHEVRGDGSVQVDVRLHGATASAAAAAQGEAIPGDPDPGPGRR